MSLTKVNYIDNSTIITAKNLNDIQDNVIQNAELIKKAAPRNLLDNSDFRNPVNQRGKTTYAGNGYSIDRWYLWSSGGTGILTIESDGILIDLNGAPAASIAQRFPKGHFKGDKYTFAAYYDDGTVQISYTRIKEYDKHDQVELGLDTSKKIICVALYEGEYTAETLPEYQSKGYGAELAECQRYYCVFTNESLGYGYIHSGKAAAIITIPMPIKMRVPPSISFDALTVKYDNKSATATNAVLFEHSSNAIRVNVGGTFETAAAIAVLSATNFALSADL